MADRSETISFRLPPAFFNQLVKNAEKRNLSHHELARQLVINCLTDSSLEEQRQEFEKLNQVMERLREDFATASACMLVYAGKWTPEKATAWARENLLGGGK